VLGGLGGEGRTGDRVTVATQRIDPDEWRIVDELYQPLRRFAAVTAPADMEPDDLLQEALVRVLRRGPLSQLDHPGAYLRRTMVNLAADYNRRMGRRRRALARIWGSEDPAPSPEYPSDLAELYRLPPRERASLYLAEVEGYSFKEVGGLLGCSEAAARKGASRGRQRLRVALAGEEAP